MITRNIGWALAWAAGGALMAIGAAVSLGINVIFALLFAGMAAAFFLVAASCLLMEPKARPDEVAPDVDSPPETDRHRWGPR